MQCVLVMKLYHSEGSDVISYMPLNLVLTLGIMALCKCVYLHTYNTISALAFVLRFKVIYIHIGSQFGNALEMIQGRGLFALQQKLEKIHYLHCKAPG